LVSFGGRRFAARFGFNTVEVSMMTTSRFVEAIQANWSEDWTISPGVSPSCSQCQSDFNMPPRQFFAKYEAGEITDEGGFSWCECDSCGSSLGGNRYAAHAIRNIGKPGEIEICHISICEDCLLFHANGDEPENWE